MTKRLSAGVVLAALSVIFTAMNASATRPPTREWRGGEDPYSSTLPLFFRSTAGTTWLQVGTAACNAADTLNSNHGSTQVWCFDKIAGDSTWPSVGAQGSLNWNHWSQYNPLVPEISKWHVTTNNVGAGGGTYAAWCGCDSIGTNPGCSDVTFWTFKEGYGDNWNYPLELDMSGQNASTGGTIKFDTLYDSECHYDYMYLEYFQTSSSQWKTLTGANGFAYFNGVSGNLDVGHGGTGRVCGDDYFFYSDQKDLGSGNVAYYGNAIWILNVTFTFPSQAGGMRVRWRGYSDGAWSDADGRGDTDGMCRIDNVLATFTSTTNTVSDGFESGDFDFPVTSAGSPGVWVTPPHQGDPYDAWHLVANPVYKNRGNTCDFTNDWMWASKPDAGIIASNQFSYYLVSPKILCDGWTGAVEEYSGYMCAPDPRNDFTNTLVRVYNAVESQWSLWNDFDGFITFGGCEFWNLNDTEDLSPFMGAEVDSLQLAWEMLDFDKPTDFSWGYHGAVTYLIDNVSVGHYDQTSTIFTTRSIDILSDTFSLVDPAHTPFLQNREEGNWSGQTGKTRVFADVDSLNVEINDVNGILSSGVTMSYRIGSGTPPTFGAWATKAMIYSDPDPNSPTDEGTYRGSFGNTTTEDFAPASETVGTDHIFIAGSTVEYYVKAVDITADTGVFPGTADDSPAIYFRFQVHPFNRVATGSTNIMLVDDYTRNALDFENSTGFQPTGGAGFGSFTSPVFDQPENMVERALALIYGGSQDFLAGVYGSPKWDIYNVQGGGSSVQREPRVISTVGAGLGGIGNDLGSPNYEAVIWLQGTFDAYSYADTTRLELKTMLNAGGKVFSTGDDVAVFLGDAVGAGDADSLVNFLGPYMGIAFTHINDDETLDRVLNVEGVAGKSLAGLKLGLYGDCPGIRHAFDRLTLADTTGGLSTSQTNSVLATYQAASPNTDGTNGRAAIIKNIRVTGGGVMVHCGFAIESLTSTSARACLLSKVLTTDFGLTAPYTGCVQSGTDAPVVASGRFGFDLAQATPNPFRDATSIRFSVPGRTHVSIEVYNILGQKVRTLVDETFEGNSYVREWDGRADAGGVVSSGIYFYKMVAGDYSATRKAVVLK